MTDRKGERAWVEEVLRSLANDVDPTQVEEGIKIHHKFHSPEEEIDILAVMSKVPGFQASELFLRHLLDFPQEHSLDADASDIQKEGVANG